MMAEKLHGRPSEIITSPDQLPVGITYDQLIEKVGGKAAGLLWIQKHLPDIPTVRMVVAPPGADIEEIISVAKLQGLKFPWIVRTSTPFDNLPGYEDYFPTIIVKTHDENLKQSIKDIKQSPQLRGVTEFEEATTIVAEYSSSTFNGTAIQHPHTDDYLMASLATKPVHEDKTHAFFYIDNFGVYRSKLLSLAGNNFSIPQRVDDQLPKIRSVFEMIQTLPGIDKNMTFQLEFGLEPYMIYQMRDFLPKAKASFQLANTHLSPSHKDFRPMVFGITPEEGIVVKVLDSENNNFGEFEAEVGLLSDPIAVMSRVSLVQYVNVERQVNLFTFGFGMLQHSDVRAIRTTPLNVFNHSPYYGVIPDGTDEGLDIHSGDLIRIKSDGMNVIFEKL